jgi:signal transduction histidine kinase
VKLKRILTNLKEVESRIDSRECLKTDQFLLVLFWMHVPFVTFFMPVGEQLIKESFFASMFLTMLAQVSYSSLKGTFANRIIFSGVLMSFSMVLIATRLGQIEMHFHILAALPLLVLYKDWRVIVFAAVLTATHHITLNYCQLNDITLSFFPLIAFKFVSGWEIVFTHIIFVLLEVGILIYTSEHLLNLGSKQKVINMRLEEKVHDRTHVIKMEMAKTEEALASAQNMKELVVKADQRKEELLHLLTHDLINPLSSAKARIDILLKKADPEAKETKHFEKIQKNHKTCFDIIDLIRNLLALEKGKYQLKIEPHNLESLLDTSYSTIKQRFDDKEIKFVTKIDPYFEVMVEEVSFINSVLNNIFTNAIKFSPRGSNIEVTAFEMDGHINLAIRDYGIGMPKQLVKDVFNPNKATSRAGTDGEQGTGFGMPLVKKFVESYRGSIKIDSIEKTDESVTDHGTTIYIKIPSFEQGENSEAS